MDKATRRRPPTTFSSKLSGKFVAVGKYSDAPPGMTSNAYEQAARRTAEVQARPRHLEKDRTSMGREAAIAARRAEEARQRARDAARLAAKSFEDSAGVHERVAQVLEQAAASGTSDASEHRRAAARHHQEAAEDRRMAQRKRLEADAE